MNLSRNENRITELPGNMAQETYEANNGKYAARVEVGQPVGAFMVTVIWEYIKIRMLLMRVTHQAI